MDLLYHCSDYAVVVKPYGVLSEGEREDALPVLLAEQLRAQSIPFVSIHPVHRLDRTTEGLLLVALHPKSAGELSRLVQEHQVKKHYTAFLTRDPGLGDEGTLTDWLFFDRRADKAFVSSPTKASAKKAVLSYTVAGSLDVDGNAVTRVEIDMETGRTHQIRVQFASRRCPLIGDRKYGSRIPYHAPALFCTGISFPWKNRQVTYTLEPHTPLSGCNTPVDL